MPPFNLGQTGLGIGARNDKVGTPAPPPPATTRVTSNGTARVTSNGTLRVIKL